jgi:tol-pal system protein YbgF
MRDEAMSLPTNVKPLSIKYFIISAFFLSTLTSCPILADDSSTTIGDLSARIAELEEQLGYKGDNSDDTNPGAKVSQEDLERLKDEIRALRDSQTGSGDINSLRDELRNLREDVRHLKSENTDLRQKENSDPQSDDAPKKSTPFIADSSEEKFIARKRKQESWNQTQVIPSPETDEETESVLKLLEQSAPEEDGEDSPLKKKQKKSVEEIRESATRHAEETAPILSTGTAQEKNSLSQYNAALTLHDKGAYKEAERAFSYFAKAYPNDPLVPQAMYWKAESTMKQGNNKAAQLLFVTAYKKNPKGPKAPDCLLRLGETFALLGKKENACITWKKLEDDFPHMTKEIKTELTTLKNQYECKQKSGKPLRSTPKAPVSTPKA